MKQLRHLLICVGWLLGWLGGEVVIAQAQTPQTLTWTSPRTNDVLLWGRAYPLTAMASSGLPVTFRVQSGPAFIADGAVTATNAGAVTLVAEQAGDTSYAPVSASLRLNPPTYTGELLGSWPGFSRGMAVAMTVTENRAYVALDTGVMVIFDVTDPRVPVVLGTAATPGGALAMQVVGGIAYVAEQVGGLQILDVRDPAKVVRLGGIDTGGIAKDVKVVGEVAYVADGAGGLEIIDVRDPASPQRLGRFDSEGDARGVEVIGSIAYIADGPRGLLILDVSDPRAPVRLGGQSGTWNAVAVQVVGHLAYIAVSIGDSRIVDVSNPRSPVPIGVMPVGRASGLHVVGSTAHVVAGNGLWAIDVSQPSAPVVMGRSATGGTGVRVIGKQAFIVRSSGLVVLDVGDLAAPALLGELGTTVNAYAVHVDGNRLYVADRDLGMVILDVSDPTAPVKVGGFGTGGVTWGVQVVGNTAYIADQISGFHIVDVRDGAAPVRLGGLNVSNLRGLQVVGSRVYLAGGSLLSIVDVSDPVSPVLLGTGPTSDAWAVQVEDQVAFVADGTEGLTTYDVSKPSQPVRLATLDTPGSADDLKVNGQVAYVADLASGLQILNVADPASPVWLAGFRAPGRALGVEVQGTTAFVANDMGVYVLDVAHPGEPVVSGVLDAAKQAYGVRVVGNIAYVADGRLGVKIVRLRSGLLQTIGLSLPATATAGGNPLAVDADSSSGLPAKLTVVSGPGRLEGGRLTLTGAGTVVVRAEQSGNEQFLPASVERSIQVLAPPTPPAITGAVVAQDGRFRFDLGGTTGVWVAVQRSLDLVSWETVSTYTVPGAVEISIPTDSASGFFRAVVVE